MPDITVEQGTQLRFCVTASFSPADAGTNFTEGSPTDVALTLNALASAAGRQSAKADLGANRAARYACHIAVDFTGETPSATGTVDVYWAPSPVSTAGNGNVAGNSGADGAAPDGALGSITLAEFLKQCKPIGSLPTHDGAVVQNGFVGVLVPETRYGQIIVVNNSGDAFEADDVEGAVWLTPMVDDVAAS